MLIKNLNIEMEEFPDGCSASKFGNTSCVFNQFGMCSLADAMGKSLSVRKYVDAIPTNCPLLNIQETKIEPEKHVFVFVGPSGSGKTTLAGLMKDLNSDMVEFISTTSRIPRQGETDGVDYHFVSREEFEAKLEADEFIESVEYSGNYYGLTKEAVYDALEKSDKCVVVVDINGCRQLQYMFEKDPNVEVKTFFVKTDISNLFLRMRSRGDSEEAILKRLDNLIATHEFENEKYCDYVINNNRDLEEVKEELKNFL